LADTKACAFAEKPETRSDVLALQIRNDITDQPEDSHEKHKRDKYLRQRIP